MLRDELHLEIIDYGADVTKSEMLNSYFELIMNHIAKNNIRNFFHTRRFF